jgi:hypothetical protein
VTATPEAATPTPMPPVDGRPPVPAPPAQGIQIVTPDVVIPAGEEHLFCFFTTYTGEDAGVSGASIYQSQGGHHNLVFVTQSSQYPDNQVIDCDLADQVGLLAASHLLVFPEPVSANVQESVLPEGMAIKFGQNTRLMFQMHYINLTDRPVLTRDVVNLSFMDPFQVGTWAAAMTDSDVKISLSPNQVTTSSISCPFTSSYSFLYLAGHMHWYGQAIDISITPSGSSGATSLYAVPEWQSDYMELPPANHYEMGELQVKAGDVLTTTCTWNNTTDSALAFPDEMCAAFGLVYPADRTIECTKGE